MRPQLSSNAQRAQMKIKEAAEKKNKTRIVGERGRGRGGWVRMHFISTD